MQKPCQKVGGTWQPYSLVHVQQERPQVSETTPQDSRVVIG
jgi:hypothetical protein